MILYLGNKLSKHGKSKSVMETLLPLFNQFSGVYSASDKRNQIFRAFDMLLSFIKYQRKVKLVIIDVYSNLAFLYAIVFSWICSILNKPFILFLHGGKLPERYNKSRRIFSWILKRAHEIIAPSKYLASFFQGKGWNVTVIPNIIEISDYPFKQRNEFTWKMLNIRGFGKPYNPMMTLKCIRILVSKGYLPQLTMLGNSDEFYYNEVVKYISDNNLQKYVSVIPKMKKEEWVSLSSHFDVMITNPVIDNTPVSIIEGLALGMVVISTRVGGVPYLCPNDEVVFVETNDSENLAQQLIQLSKNPQKVADLSQQGRNFSENFSWEMVAPKWKALFDSIHE